MDKSTLSNYGWVVIAVLVLSVMIALATPFGTYISNGVKSTTEGLFDVQQKAMGVAGLIVEDQSFDNIGVSGGTSTPILNENGFYYEQLYTGYVSSYGLNIATIFRQNGFCDIILYGDASGTENATYTVENGKLHLDTSMGNLTFAIGNNGTELSCSELGTVFGLNADSNIIIDGVYAYIYEDDWREHWKGYEVITFDKSMSSYSAFKASINGIPVTQIGSSAFRYCSELSSFIVPSGIVFLGDYSFGDCGKLNQITIPDSVETINAWAFRGCTNLNTIKYNGTTEQWNNIVKGDNWNIDIPATEVVCSNGTVNLS